MRGMKYLAINRCPNHGVESISLEDEDGNGVRLTGHKCCGSWTMVKKFQLNAHLLRAAADEFESAAIEAEESP